jgi:hypothetical protein
MAKTKPVKWAIGADEPDDLQDFLSNDDILQKHTNKKTKEIDWPGKGPYRFKVKRLTVKENRNGDDRISAMLVLDEPKGSDAASWNGYLVWDGFNVVEGPSLSFLKRFLKGLGLSWDDFIKRSKQDDQDPPHIVQIGGVKFEGAKDPTVVATVKVAPADEYNDDEHWEIARYVPPEDASDEDADDDADADDDGDDVMSMDDDADDDSADGEDADDDGDDDSDEDDDPWTREDLEDEDFDTVAEVAKDDFGFKAKDLKPFKKDEDVEGLLDAMFPDDGDDDDDDGDEDGDDSNEEAVAELREELDGLKIAALRKRALRNDEDADLDGLKKPGLIDLIVQQELNEPPF